MRIREVECARFFNMRRRVLIAVTGIVLAAAVSAAVWRVRSPSMEESASKAGLHPAALVSDAVTLMALERRGLALHHVLHAGDAKAAFLVESAIYREAIAILEGDLEELDQRPAIGGEIAPNHPFDRRWLR